MIYMGASKLGDGPRPKWEAVKKIKYGYDYAWLEINLALY